MLPISFPPYASTVLRLKLSVLTLIQWSSDKVLIYPWLSADDYYQSQAQDFKFPLVV